MDHNTRPQMTSYMHANRDPQETLHAMHYEHAEEPGKSLPWATRWAHLASGLSFAEPSQRAQESFSKIFAMSCLMRRLAKFFRSQEADQGHIKDKEEVIVEVRDEVTTLF